MRVITILFLILLVISCQKKDYNIKIVNNYFEDVYGLNVGTYQSDTLKINETSSVFTIKKGDLVIRYYSVSGLKFESKIIMTGSNHNLIFVINENGELVSF